MDWLPPWSLIEGILRTLVLPAFSGAAVVFAIVCAATKRPEARVAGGALALIVGLAAGNHFRELLDWWPVDAPEGDDASKQASWWHLSRGWTALLPITAAATALGLAAALLSKRTGRTVGIVMWVIAAAGAAWWLGEALPPVSKLTAVAVLAAVIVLDHEALMLAARRTLPRTSLLALTVPWCASAAAVLIFAHSARFSDLAGLMAASLCGVGLIAALWKTDTSASFATPSAFLPPLMLAGAANTYSEVPLAAFACVAFAPCGLWLLTLPPLRRLSPRAFAAVAIALVIIPCVVGVALAASKEKLDFGE